MYKKNRLRKLRYILTHPIRYHKARNTRKVFTNILEEIEERIKKS